jgi:hypothetical protein
VPIADKRENKGRTEQRFKIEEGENMLHHYRNLLENVRNRTQTTWSPADLAYYTQTACIMGMKALRENRTIHFDAEKQQLV